MATAVSVILKSLESISAELTDEHKRLFAAYKRFLERKSKRDIIKVRKQIGL